MKITDHSFEQLKIGLCNIGLEAGTTVMLHVSFRAIGKIEGGATTLIKAILQIVGSEGTILMLVGSNDAFYDIADWPPHIMKKKLNVRKPFDIANTPANLDWGITGEVLRTWDESYRSQHPDYSFAAVGRLARKLTSEHNINYCHGPSSPLAKLCDLNGKVLILGAPFHSVTLVHLCEHLAHVARKQVISYQVPIFREGKRKIISIERFNTHHNIPGYEPKDYFDSMIRDYLNSVHGNSGKVGNADSFLLNSIEFRDFGVQWLEQHLPPAK